MNTANDLGFIDVTPVDYVEVRQVRDAETRKRRRVGNMIFAAVFSIAAIGWFLVLRPARLGGPASFVMVQGVSMNPTYHTGDLVIAHTQPSYAVGDVIAYQVPQGDVGAGLTVIHRIVGGSAATGFITKGDANPAPDDWRPTLAQVEGRAWFVVPKGGVILAFLHAPIPLAGLAAAGVVVWVVYQEETPSLRRRRRPTLDLPPEVERADPPHPAEGSLGDQVEDERVLGAALAGDQVHGPAGVREGSGSTGDGDRVVARVVERALDRH